MQRLLPNSVYRFLRSPKQQEIIRRVRSTFKTAAALEARYRKAKAHVDKLTQSILGRAFRGELVSQDPNDEPASVLLETNSKAKGCHMPNTDLGISIVEGAHGIAITFFHYDPVRFGLVRPLQGRE